MIEKQDKRVSIIVPVYNAEQFLTVCLHSLSAQRGNDIEFILIDDGSTDKCPSMLDDFASLDTRARVIHKRNGGVSAARNAGIDAASGDFICFLDSDDILYDRFAERLRPYLAESYDAVFFSWMNLPAADTSPPVGDIPSGEHLCTPEELQTIILNSLCPSQPLLKTPMRFRGSRGVWGMVFRADIVKTFNIRFREDMKLAEDVVFRLQYLALCASAVCLSDVLYFYRVSEASLLHKRDTNVENDIFLTLSSLRAVIARDYGGDEAMLLRFWSTVILESRFYLIKYLLNAEYAIPLSKQLTLYDAFRRRDIIGDAIAKCDRRQLQRPINLLLDAYRIKDTRRSLRSARRALAPARSFKALAERLGVAPGFKRLIRRFR